MQFSVGLVHLGGREYGRRRLAVSPMLTSMFLSLVFGIWVRRLQATMSPTSCHVNSVDGDSDQGLSILKMRIHPHQVRRMRFLGAQAVAARHPEPPSAVGLRQAEEVGAPQHSICAPGWGAGGAAGECPLPGPQGDV